MPQKLNDKCVFPQSPTTSFREREPTAPEIAARGNPRMSIDFSRQNRVIPNSLGQTTRYGENDRNFRAMNADGKPFALNTMNGGGPDVRSRSFGEASQHLSPTKGK